MPAAPGAAVDEDEDGCGVASGAIDIEPLDLGRSVSDALGLANVSSRQFAVADAALDQLVTVRRIGGLIIGRVERGLVIVEENRRAFFGHRTSAIRSFSHITLASIARENSFSA